ncbi:hypothetical protein ACWCQM_37070 [Streptomyces sp. NPDC002125]
MKNHCFRPIAPQQVEALAAPYKAILPTVLVNANEVGELSPRTTKPPPL